MSVIRLDKFLANAGCGTRSEVKQQLKKGMVTVNGAIVRQPELKIDAQRDRVAIGGKPVALEEFHYFMLNKPQGYLSATEDKRQRVVLDLLPEEQRRGLFPVGRLDIDTEGLLLLTDDGALAHELLSPRKHVDKTYFARIEGIVTQEDVWRFREGLDIGEKRRTLPARLVILSGEEETEAGYSLAEVTIREGKFHQVKRMFEAVGKRVVYLRRISMGSLCLDEKLGLGEYRRLTEDEIKGLKKD